MVLFQYDSQLMRYHQLPQDQQRTTLAGHQLIYSQPTKNRQNQQIRHYFHHNPTKHANKSFCIFAGILAIVIMALVTFVLLFSWETQSSTTQTLVSAQQSKDEGNSVKNIAVNNQNTTLLDLTQTNINQSAYYTSKIRNNSQNMIEKLETKQQTKNENDQTSSKIMTTTKSNDNQKQTASIVQKQNNQPKTTQNRYKPLENIADSLVYTRKAGRGYDLQQAYYRKKAKGTVSKPDIMHATNITPSNNAPIPTKYKSEEIGPKKINYGRGYYNEYNYKKPNKVPKNDGDMQKPVQIDNKLKYNNQQAKVTVQQSFTNQQQIKNHIFQVPRKIWIYTQSYLKQSYMSQLYEWNHKIYGDNYTIQQINEQNYEKYVDPSIVTKIKIYRQHFQQKIKKISSKLKNRQEIINRLFKETVMSHVLLQNGGIVIDRQLLLTQSLEWLRHIDSNPYVNRDLRTKPTEIFAFYDLSMSSVSYSKNHLTNFQITQPYRMTKRIPGITMQFMAAKRQSLFLKQVCKYMLYCLDNPQQEFKFMMDDKVLLQIVKSQELFSKPFTTSALRALISQTAIIQKKNKNRPNDLSALPNAYESAFDQYGLSTMNGAYGPKRLQYMLLPPVQYQKKFLTEVPLEQFQTMFGVLRYCAFIPESMRKQQKFFQQINRQSIKIMKGSFLQEMCIDQTDPKDNLYINKQIPQTNLQGPQWTSLPRRVWMIWDTGFENASLANELMIKNTMRKALQSGVNATLITNNNIKDYLDQDILKKIQYAVSHPAFKVYPPLKSNLMRIALVYKHGGIYVDASVIFVENFDWLFFISRVPSNYIWNRFGALPKILLSFHPWFRYPAQWTIDATHNTKSTIKLCYENFFFAAQPESELLHDWFQLYLDNLKKPYKQIQTLLRDTGIYPWRFMTNQNNTYAIAMQSLRMAIFRKQIQLDAQGKGQYINANHYYGAWTLNQFVGIEKYRCSSYNNFNLDIPKCKTNTWLVDYSQQYVQGLLGQTRFFIKLHRDDQKYLNNAFSQRYDGFFDFHPNSIVAKNLLSHGENIKKQGNKIKLVFKEDIIMD